MTMYPDWVEKLPQIKTPFPGAVGWLMSSPHGQVVFWEFPNGAEVPPHRHGPQMGFILEGRTVMTIDGKTQAWQAGETFTIGDQVEHSAVVDPGTCIIEFYQESDRHTAQGIALSSSDGARRHDRGSSHPDVTGWQGPHEYFQFIEADDVRPPMVMDVLRGRQLGVVFRDVVPAPVLKALIANFTTSPARQTRGADAPGQYLGAYHYNKTIKEYLDQTDAVRANLDVALDVPGEPLRLLRQQLREAFALSGIRFRPACHGGREACAGIFRSWQGQQGFALAPHEDRGQCESPKQSGFEIQRVAAHVIVGLNVCLDNGPGGRLIVWNLCPDETTRARLGVQYTGSPYTTESLAGIERVLLDVRPGDIYLLNSSHVHAVEAVSDTDDTRVTLSMLLGFVDNETVISWT